MKKYTKQISALFIGFALVSIITSCGSEQKQNETLSQDEAIMEEVAEEEASHAQKVFYAMPSPFEVAALLRASGVSFQKDILNSVDNISNYSTSKSQALNLGVYGADLSLTTIYGHTQATMFYLSAIKTLSDKLGVAGAFDPSKMQRIEKNKTNQDSLQSMVAESYEIANAYLKDHERVTLSSMILAGGWIEGLYIATQLTNTDQPNEELLLLIADERFSLENLVALLESNKSDQNISELLPDFIALNEVFMKIDEQGSQAAIVENTDKESHSMTIGGGSSTSISPEVLKEIREKVAEIRNRYVQ